MTVGPLMPSTDPQLSHFQPPQPQGQGQIPIVYVNSFDAAISPTEVTFIAKQNNVRLFEIKLAFPTARSLGEALLKGVSYYDKATGTVTPTTDEILAKIKAMENKP